MTRDPRLDRVARRIPDRTVPASAVRASQQRRYTRGPLQSTRELTTKLTAFAVIATLVIGGLLAAQMAAGSDPALGPKAAAQTKKASAKPSNNGSSSSSSNGSGSDPYSQSYGSDGYYYGGSGYSAGSGGYSSGSGGYSYSAPPVTSSTS
ncbi:MAG TPA: hypothetical protein VLB79_02520 [Solirubrobacterales bacterium]|nr:hypothetical protein [Solirubrobacterales bacterium]